MCTDGRLKNRKSYTRDSYKDVLLSFSYAIVSQSAPNKKGGGGGGRGIFKSNILVCTKRQKAIYENRKHETTNGIKICHLNGAIIPPKDC